MRHKCLKPHSAVLHRLLTSNLKLLSVPSEELTMYTPLPHIVFAVKFLSDFRKRNEVNEANNCAIIWRTLLQLMSYWTLYFAYIFFNFFLKQPWRAFIPKSFTSHKVTCSSTQIKKKPMSPVACLWCSTTWPDIQFSFMLNGHAAEVKYLVL